MPSPRFPISLLYQDAPKSAKVNPYKVPNAKELQQLAQKVSQGEKLKGGVDIVFCSDEKVRELNKAYRKLDKVTDVLSFEWHEDDFAGEIFIATAQTERQAPRFNNNYSNELRRVVVHGMLHLCGYDHLKTGERNVMRAKEDVYLGMGGGGEVQATGKSQPGSEGKAPKTSKSAAKKPKVKGAGKPATPKPKVGTVKSTPKNKTTRKVSRPAR